MKILIDSNILISTIWNTNSLVAETLFYITLKHETYLTDYNIEELKRVIKKKMPDKYAKLENLLKNLNYKIIPAITETEIPIQDIKDQPILNSAIKYNIDIILTGDKDFLDLGLIHPTCMNVTDFRKFEGLK